MLGELILPHLILLLSELILLIIIFLGPSCAIWGKVFFAHCRMLISRVNMEYGLARVQIVTGIYKPGLGFQKFRRLLNFFFNNYRLYLDLSVLP